MSVKEAFTAEQWRMVGSAPFLVGMFVAGSSPSGPIGMLTEMLAAEKAVTLEASQPDGLPLVREIEADLVAEHLTRDLGTIDGSPAGQERVLRELGRALGIVDAHARAEASAFRAWLYRVAQHVVRAAPEGGPVTAGRTFVSDEETAALTTLGELLGVPR
ncbi:hypothetical protein BJQ94_13375 [Cryobacterium sp. SO2]|uniref:hypothetical protein n=1 Tax=Cryobacterium sp. SO2 TaxID=1897060 RepID=UPI00223DA278|nr:hypothetical protein [Cryobacterium sp. SO2]WEO76350.1 hypothetical protein BJQ94_13375 [Cryobacterium sp. SO2]